VIVLSRSRVSSATTVQRGDYNLRAQVIKVRLMAKEHLGRYFNTADCLRKVRCTGLGGFQLAVCVRQLDHPDERSA
jgi:hypothetical protein